MTLTTRAAVAAGALLLLFQALAPAQSRKKKDEDFTQTLESVPDPPATLAADPTRLWFYSTPLSARGLLSQQTRDALKNLIGASRGSQTIRIRALVAGTGDLRRLPQLISEVFTEKKLPLPVVTVLQVGSLGLDGAQVQLQAVFQDRRAVNANGLTFVAAHAAKAETAAVAVAPLLAHSAAEVSRQLAAGGLEPADLVEATCLVSALEGASALRETLARAWPKLPATLVQAQRSAVGTAWAACSAVARNRQAPKANVEFAGAAEGKSAPAARTAARLLFAGSQVAYRYQEEDGRLAFQRLEKNLQAGGSSLRRAVLVDAFPLSPQLGALAARLLPEFSDNRRPPAGAVLPIEGLPGLDASFALEAIVLAASSPQ